MNNSDEIEAIKKRIEYSLDGEIGNVILPVDIHISDMLEYLYPEDKVDIVSEKGIVLIRDAVVKDLFKEGGNN